MISIFDLRLVSNFGSIFNDDLFQAITISHDGRGDVAVLRDNCLTYLNGVFRAFVDMVEGRSRLGYKLDLARDFVSSFYNNNKKKNHEDKGTMEGYDLIMRFRRSQLFKSIKFSNETCLIITTVSKRDRPLFSPWNLQSIAFERKLRLV